LTLDVFFSSTCSGICALQASLLILGIILGVGRAECEVAIHGGADVGIDCKKVQEIDN
jgi:hypothetical protein